MPFLASSTERTCYHRCKQFFYAPCIGTLCRSGSTGADLFSYLVYQVWHCPFLKYLNYPTTVVMCSLVCFLLFFLQSSCRVPIAPSKPKFFNPHPPCWQPQWPDCQWWTLDGTAQAPRWAQKAALRDRNFPDPPPGGGRCSVPRDAGRRAPSHGSYGPLPRVRASQPLGTSRNASEYSGS